MKTIGIAATFASVDIAYFHPVYGTGYKYFEVLE